MSLATLRITITASPPSNPLLDVVGAVADDLRRTAADLAAQMERVGRIMAEPIDPETEAMVLALGKGVD